MKSFRDAVGKQSMACGICGTEFKCDLVHINNPKCPNCLFQERQISKNTVEKVIKDAGKYKGTFEFKLETKDQKLTAVRAQGEIFAATAGPDLMLTEFIENAFDATKRRIILNALTEVIQQMNFTPDFQRIAFEKYNIPITEFNKKYTLTAEQESDLKKLYTKIMEVIKSQNKIQSEIIIEMDDNKQEVRIIDSGTGIEHPIHICEKPFVSLKTGEDYSVGQFARGSQVFRAFCDLMQIYSIRAQPSNRELENIKINNLDVSKTDTNSILLKFPWDFPGGDYEFSLPDEYKKLSNNTKPGTVVILSNWKENYYSALSKHVKKLEYRLQHHFGFALDDMFNINLKIRHNKKEYNICKMDFDELAKENNLSKIDRKFELPNMPLKDKQGNLCGEIEFHVYRTHRSYQHQYKEPFLVINGRPIGDTSISEIPELSGFSDIWKSSTITGYVVCNEIQINQMRNGIAPSTVRQSFFDSMKAASIDLKKLNSAWKNELSSAQDKTIMSEVVQTVSSYLAKKGIKFNFKNPLQKGAQKDPNNKAGEEITDDRVSNEAGGPNQGLISSQDGEEVDIGYKKVKIKPKGGKWEPNTVVVPHGSKKKDGNTVITVKVKRSLVSKGGRRVRKSYSGPDLDFNVDEDCGNELSYFEPAPPTVMVQSEHEAWKKLVKKAKNQTNAEKFEKNKKQYLMGRYLWEIINNEATYSGDDMTDNERKDLFWTYYHDLMGTK